MVPPLLANCGDASLRAFLVSFKTSEWRPSLFILGQGCLFCAHGWYLQCTYKSRWVWRSQAGWHCCCLLQGGAHWLPFVSSTPHQMGLSTGWVRQTWRRPMPRWRAWQSRSRQTWSCWGSTRRPGARCATTLFGNVWVTTTSWRSGEEPGGDRVSQQPSCIFTVWAVRAAEPATPLRVWVLELPNKGTRASPLLADEIAFLLLLLSFWWANCWWKFACV